MLKRILLSGLLVALFSMSAFSDEKPLTDGGVEAVLDAQLDALQAQPTVDAGTIIDDYQDEKGWMTDPQKGVIFAKGTAKVVIDGDIAGAEAFRRRDVAATMALMFARMEIIETIASEMSGEQMMVIPGNPITPELSEESQGAIDAYRNKAMEVFSAHDKDDLVQQVEDKQLSGDELIATLEQVASKDEQAELKELQKAYKAGLEELAGIKTKLSEITNKVELTSKMPIFGCTIIAQAESIKELGKGEHELMVAVLMVWSKKLQEGASAILKGEDVTYTPDKKGRTIREWLKEQDLSTILGGRQFIDKDGKMWFIGISSRVLEGNTVKQKQAERTAASFARQNAVLSLFAEASAAESAMQSASQFENSQGKEITEVVEEMSINTSAKYEKLQINGLQRLIGRAFHHPLLNSSAHTEIYGINTADVTALRNIRDNFYATFKEVAAAQERERGKVAELEKQYEASKDNPQARAEGAAEARQIMTGKPSEVIDAQEVSPAGKIRSGATTIQDNGDEDTF